MSKLEGKVAVITEAIADGTNENTSPDLAETKSLDAVEEDKS
jgi:hypothetical protein